MSLRNLVIQSARSRPDALAVQDSSTRLTYRELDQVANQLAHALAQLGVRAGDRIGIWLSKSVYAVASMQAILRLNAIYVPLDPLNPATRIRTIVQDCAMHVLMTTGQQAITLEQDHPQEITYLCIDQVDLRTFPQIAGAWPEPVEDAIAFILYTSGSTGRPKGVCISNRNALAFIEWAATMLGATEHDRFANHAPLHFDLSVLDLYAAFYAGASTHLIPDGLSYAPQQLVTFLLKEEITVWYSVPSVLILMMEQGGLLNTTAPALRALLFAGEPFPIKHLRKLYQHWTHVRFCNLYGPTETNVCTCYEVTHLADDWQKPVPIGTACSGDTVWAQKADGTTTRTGEEGELMVTGPTVMAGYWGLPPRSKQPYATGDLVRLLDDGNYLYLGRLDHMLKVRGHRIEAGDVEAVLAQHPAIQQAAVGVTGTGLDARLKAFIVPASLEEIPTLLELKRHCAERLPRYMIIDTVQVLQELPRNRNGKVEMQTLLTINMQ